MKNVIKNKTLFVAEKLLEITTQKPYRVQGSGITLEKDDVFELSNEEIIETLKRLEGRGIVSFNDEEDKYDPDHLDYIVLYFEKDKLVDFIETAKDRLYKLTTQYKDKEELNYVLTALASFLRFESSKEVVDFSELDNKYIDVALWIADYSEALKIIYEDEPDVEWKDLKRPQVIGVLEVPKKFVVIDPQTIKRLESEIRQIVIMPQQKRIKLFLKNNNAGVDWRCANCGHFLKKRIESEKQMVNYLNDFLICKFKVCYKCRKRNFFSLNQKGEIKFLTTGEKMFSEKETKKEKIKKLNILIRKANKIRAQNEKS